MKFIMTQRKTTVPAEIREYAEEKLAKLEKYFAKDTTVNLTFSELRENKIIEATISHNGIFFRAQEREKEWNDVIIDVCEVLERQIRKHKTKLSKRIRETAFDGYVPTEAEVEIDYDVSRVKQFNVTPLSVDEAILQMEMLGHKFFFFKNADDNDNYAVLYIRDNGGYGIIQG